MKKPRHIEKRLEFLFALKLVEKFQLIWWDWDLPPVSGPL